MIPSAFEYHAPASVEEALRLLGSLGPDAKLLAGGHSLLPMMKLRFAQPSHLIDLGRVSPLRGIAERDGLIHIGAMTTEAGLLASPLLRERCPLIPEAAALIADPQVRYRGTVGGDLAHGDPGNDHPAVMIALDAEFMLQSARGTRAVAAQRFYTGMFETALAPDEILTEIRVRPFGPGTGWAYEKLKRKTGDFATAAAAVVLRIESGRCAAARIALTNVGPTALRADVAEKALVGGGVDTAAVEAAAQAAMSICDPAEDLRGDREYRTAMAGEMTRRAIRRALARARGG